MEIQEKERIILEIATPEGRLYREQVSSVNLPTGMGSMGVLRNHAPVICTLVWGVLEYIKGGKKYRFAISDGIADIKNNFVLVLVHTAERSDEIDIKRARAALERAKERLAKPGKDADTLQANAALRRAMTRIKATEREKSVK